MDCFQLDDFPLIPSRMARRVQVASTVLAMLAVLLSGVFWPGKAFLIFVLLCTLFCYEPPARRVTALGKNGEQWHVVINGTEREVTLTGDQLVLPWLTVLQLRCESSGKTLSLALWPDSAGTESLRRLRVVLRHS